jgi:hypothetical protein
MADIKQEVINGILSGAREEVATSKARDAMDRRWPSWGPSQISSTIAGG